MMFIQSIFNSIELSQEARKVKKVVFNRL